MDRFRFGFGVAPYSSMQRWKRCGSSSFALLRLFFAVRVHKVVIKVGRVTACVVIQLSGDVHSRTELRVGMKNWGLECGHLFAFVELSRGSGQYALP